MVSYLYRNREGSSLSLKDGWEYQGTQTSFPLAVEKADNTVYTVSATLPAFSDRTESIAFKSENIYYRVLIDGTVIQSFTEADAGIGTAPGDHWNIILLPPSSGGRKISIEMKIVYRSGSNFIRNVYFGSYQELSTLLLKKSLPGMIACIFSAILCLLFIFIDLFLRQKDSSRRTLLWLGLFSFLIVVWSFCQSPILLLSTEYQYFIRCLTYASLSAAVGMMILYYADYRRKRFRLPLYIFGLSFVLYGSICIILDRQHILLFTQSIKYVLTVLACILLVGTFTSIRSLTSAGKGNFENRVINWGNLLLIFVGSIEIVNARIYGAEDYSSNIRIALLVYTFFVGICEMKKGYDNAGLLREAEIIRRIAYIDSLTGLKNRAAFDEMLKKILEDPGPKPGVFQFDLNNLKATNDEHGHSSGDRLIREAAHILSGAFDGIGECYRNGGDEFVVLVDSQKIPQASSGIQKLNDLVLRHNQESDLPFPVSIAFGYAEFSGETDRDFMDTLRRADREMYRKKFQMKGLTLSGKDAYRKAEYPDE